MASAAIPESESSATPLPETIAILERLIGFPTVSRNSNLDLIGWVEAYLTGLGVTSRLTYDAKRAKANLFATIGEGTGDGLVLSGHTDVVPVDGQEWATDPFRATMCDGRIYGRGTADMKGFIASVLAAVPAVLAARRSEPIHIALTFDEEVGCIGVRSLIADMIAQGVTPHGCIVGEPTSMRVIGGHKGSSVYRCTVRGKEMHASLAPQGVNAIDYAARLILRLREIQQRLKDEERRHSGYDIPYTTLNTGIVQGGCASNIVTGRCEFRFDIRFLPWTPAESILAELEVYARNELLPEMRELTADCEIEFEKMGNVPPLQVDDNEALTRYVQHLIGRREAPGYVGFGTEGGLFQNAGIASVICGPGSIAQAHGPDEFVTLGQLALCDEFLRSLIALPLETTASQKSDWSTF